MHVIVQGETVNLTHRPLPATHQCISDLVTHLKSCWARPGFEPGTSRTLSENHTPRPTSQTQWIIGCVIINCKCAPRPLLSTVEGQAKESLSEMLLILARQV